MKYKSGLWWSKTFGKVVATDYTQYLVQYNCMQEYLDVYTEEYFDIYSRDGTITDSLLEEIKAIISEMLPHYDITT